MPSARYLHKVSINSAYVIGMVTMVALAESLREHVRLADLLDVTLISLLLYVAFVWLRARASRSLGLIAITLSVVFLLSLWLDLYLTGMVFRYGSVGIVLALVVVFQNDLRHGFERLTSSRWFRRSSVDEPSKRLIDTLVESIAAMAQQRIGALIVFPGLQPLDRHLRGGVAVDAEVSQPLLISIFHPKSPGHDGAVLIQHNRISQLGLHLPLTTQVSKIRDGGTRHAAALGLAECCDATVLILSEERGAISIAHNGELTLVDLSDLSDQLRRCVVAAEVGHGTNTASWLADFATAMTAIACSLSLWFLFAYKTDTIQRTYVVPIEYRNLPEGWEILEPKSNYAEVTLSGSEPVFSLLDPTKVAVSLEAVLDKGENVVRWETEPNLKNVPAELRIERIAPENVTVTVRRKAAEEP